MSRVYKLSADFIFLFHTAVFLMIVFGWALPHAYLWMYQVTLVLTLALGAMTGSCILTRLEWSLRKLHHRAPKNKFFIAHYVHKWTSKEIPPKVLNTVTASYMSVSLLVQIYLFYQG